MDSTWTDGTRRGHTIGVTPASDGSTYAIGAASITNQSTVSYCVDQTGVIRAGTVANATSGCSTANAAISS